MPETKLKDLLRDRNSPRLKPNKLVLLVEDAIGIYEPLSLFFEADGYTLLWAANGREALELLTSMVELPAVILLDLTMPVMDGYAFRAEQKKDPRLSSIPILIMTGDSHPEEKRIKLGAQGSIRKPIADIGLLLDTVRKYCIQEPIKISA